MSLTNWILSGCIFIAVVLYIIGLIRKITLLSKISSIFILPCIEAISILLLLNYLPDAFHILLVNTIALSLVCITEVLFLFENTKALRIISRLIFLLSQLTWLELYKSAFFIFRVPDWLSIIAGTFYLGIIVITLIFTGKQKLYKYLNYILSMVVVFSISFPTFINLCFNPALHTILCFSGTTCTIGTTIFYIFNNSRFNFKYKNSIFLLLLIISQCLITASNILIIR